MRCNFGLLVEDEGAQRVRARESSEMKMKCMQDHWQSDVLETTAFGDGSAVGGYQKKIPIEWQCGWCGRRVFVREMVTGWTIRRTDHARAKGDS